MKIPCGYFLKDFTIIFLNFYMSEIKKSNKTCPKIMVSIFLTMKAHDL
jgi:hypothetical protein